MRSAIILVGGEARRANGREKYFFVHGGKTFIERLTTSLRQVTDEIVIVAKDPEQCSRFFHLNTVRCISDIRKGIGPIGGLHAGVAASHGELLFVSACDMPCVNPSVVGYLFTAIGDHDAAIPCWNQEMFEPLHAVYRRASLLRYLETHTSLSLREMILNLDTVYVPVESLRQYDDTLTTFTNINRLDELRRFNNGA